LEIGNIITERKKRVEVRTKFLTVGKLKLWNGLSIAANSPHLSTFRSFINQ